MKEVRYRMDKNLANTIVGFYASFGGYEAAFQKFLEHKEQNLADIVTYNILLKCCVSQNLIDEALGLFHELEKLKVEPDEVSFMLLFTLCAHTCALEVGTKIHKTTLHSMFWTI
jgi:pentatricopeptide repeat protein